MIAKKVVTGVVFLLVLFLRTGEKIKGFTARLTVRHGPCLTPTEASQSYQPIERWLLSGNLEGVVYMEGTGGVYRPRQPKLSQFYQCIEEHFEHFEQLYPERYERQYGFWRPVVREVILKYLDCGDLHQGFARIRCQECEDE